jgi:hypothetical protein
MLPDTVLTLVKQQLKSINCTPTARTPIDHVAWDLLHWHLRVLNDLIKLADAAAKQLPGVHTGLLAGARKAHCGHAPRVTGWDGDDSVSLMQNWATWTSALTGHPLWNQLETLFTLFGRLSKLLMQDFSAQDPQVDEIATLVDELRHVVHRHFSGVPTEVDDVGCATAGCACHPDLWLSATGLRRGEGEGVVALLLNHSVYLHATWRHFVPFLKRHGSLIKYSSWVLESSNAVWKDILRRRVTYGGSRSNTAYEPGKQALARFLRITHPDIQEHSKRTAATRRCGACGDVKSIGHSKRCRAADDSMLSDADLQALMGTQLEFTLD